MMVMVMEMMTMTDCDDDCYLTRRKTTMMIMVIALMSALFNINVIRRCS